MAKPPKQPPPAAPPNREVLATREGLEAWLRLQPREVSVAIAARAALRVLPLFESYEPEDGGQFAESMVKLFRANAIARVAARYPTRTNDFPANARVAAVAAAFAAHASHTAYTRAAVFAADAAGYAAHAAYADTSADAAADAIRATGNARATNAHAADDNTDVADDNAGTDAARLAEDPTGLSVCPKTY